MVEEDHDLARAHFDRASQEFAQLPTTPQFPTRGISVLLSVLSTPEVDEAAALVAEAERLDLAMTHVARGYLRFARAVTLGRAGQHTEAMESVAEGEELLRALADGWVHHAFRLTAQAAVEDGWGTPAPWLIEALAGFEARELARGADASRALLRRAGVSVPRREQADLRVPSGWRSVGVTTREAEVLALLGEGMTNKEIAERLFLSSRTVERHLANVGLKLGTSTRSELIAAAARVVLD